MWGVVPAAGIGARMAADRPKQYLPLAGKTVIQHTIERLLSHSEIEGVVVSVAVEDPWWPTLSWSAPERIQVVEGGAERSDSVLHALEWLASHTTEDPWVLVHDAARPCLSGEDLQQLIVQLRNHPVGGILAAPVADTLKRSDGEQGIAETVDRSQLWRALTPQMFRLQALYHALLSVREAGVAITDDAQAMEQQEATPLLVEGAATNLKITRPGDLAIAEEILRGAVG